MRLILGSLIFVLACGTTVSTTPVNAPPHAMHPRPDDTVEVFTSGAPHDRSFTDVAYLEAAQDSTDSLDGTPELIAALRGRGAKMGCDGIVLGAPTTDPYGRGLILQGPRKGIVATCIVYN